VAQGGRRSPFAVTLTASQRRFLKRLVRRPTAQQRQVTRARIVLGAAAGLANAHIARKLGIAPNTVGKWRKRFAQEGFDGLADRKRSGRPRAFPQRWSPTPRRSPVSCPQPAGSRGHAGALPNCATSCWSAAWSGRCRPRRCGAGWPRIRSSRGSTGRGSFPAIRSLPPRQGWCSICTRVSSPAALGAGEFVISADEKTSIQARCRCHPSLPPGQARMMRVEHEYERGGALAYLAAWEVHHARLFGRCEASTGIEPFGRLVAQVMTAEPYASAERVFWIVDNGSSHRGQASIQRLEGRYTNLRLIHLPVHASWLNQIEIYFSVVQRKVLTPNDFTDLIEVEQRLLGFQRRYEHAAEPFDWRFTRTDLDRLLRRLDETAHLTKAA
jgi:DDE superfamily endonuclease/Helix-turn-helix domain